MVPLSLVPPRYVTPWSVWPSSVRSEEGTPVPWIPGEGVELGIAAPVGVDLERRALIGGTASVGHSVQQVAIGDQGAIRDAAVVGCWPQTGATP